MPLNMSTAYALRPVLRGLHLREGLALRGCIELIRQYHLGGNAGYTATARATMRKHWESPRR